MTHYQQGGFNAVRDGRAWSGQRRKEQTNWSDLLQVEYLTMDIRSLMKQGSKADASSSNLSGKDKAKLLKMMREQQKQREVPVPPKKVPHSVAPVKQASQQSGLPACFFDADPPVIPKSNAAQSAPLAATKVDAPKSTGVSSLPQGFFDNPVEDLSARGITMEQYTAKMEKEEQAELDSFLTEVKRKTLFGLALW